MLFDQAFIDSLPDLKMYSNPGVVMLCRYLQVFREKIELWYSRLPDEEKKDMRSRLRSLEDWTYLPAVYELYIHEYCWSKGWKIAKNPPVNGQTPDYLVTPDHGEPFYLEVASVFESPEQRKPKKQVDQLLDKLNGMEVPFVLIVQLEEWPKNQLSPGRIARNIEHRLKVAISSGDAASVSPVINLADYGLAGKILARHSPDSERSMAMFTPPIGVGLPNFKGMKDTINKKVNKYKNLNQPLVIGVCTTDIFPLNQHTLETVLYGEEQIVIELSTGNTSLGRDARGLLTPKPGSAKPFNTRVSGILYAEVERLNADLQIGMKVMHNPWATHALSDLIFSDLPQLVQSHGETGTVTLTWKDPAGNSQASAS